MLVKRVFHSMLMRKLGFTLTELCVVIAVVAIVAAILFPVLAAAKGEAGKTAALNNVSQIGKAIHLYLADSDDYLPSFFPGLSHWPGYAGSVSKVGGSTFPEIYNPYVKSQGVWLSPQDRLLRPGRSSFTINEQLAYSWSMAGIARPSEAIYLTDRSDIDTGSLSPSEVYAWWTFTDANPFSEGSLPGKVDPVSVAAAIDPIRYTGDKGLYLFLDSHAASLSFGLTWGDSAHNLHLATKI